MISYEKFMSIPIAMYKTVGIDILKLKGPFSFWANLTFWVAFINLNTIILAELIFFLKTFGQYSNFLEATAIAPCIGFCVMSDFKIFTIRFHATSIESVQKILKTIHPKTQTGQSRMQVSHYMAHMTFIVISFLILATTLIWLFNLSAIGRSIVGVCFMEEEFGRRLPYLTWYPFGIDHMAVYLATYFHQIFAGHTAIIFTIGADIFLCCIVAQLVMHFDGVADDLRQYVTSGQGRDLEFLTMSVRKHQILLRLCDELNSTFSFSILFNFLASSFIICLVGFQTTAGATTKLEFLKYVLFLLGSSNQILLICYFGNMLTDSSSDIAYGACENDWSYANQSYKKMLLFVIMRGQKASALKPLMFNCVSLKSFNKVCSIAYQFFALLRTMYSK